MYSQHPKNVWPTMSKNNWPKMSKRVFISILHSILLLYKNRFKWHSITGMTLVLLSYGLPFHPFLNERASSTLGQRSYNPQPNPKHQGKQQESLGDPAWRLYLFRPLFLHLELQLKVLQKLHIHSTNITSENTEHAVSNRLTQIKIKYDHLSSRMQNV